MISTGDGITASCQINRMLMLNSHGMASSSRRRLRVMSGDLQLARGDGRRLIPNLRDFISDGVDDFDEVWIERGFEGAGTGQIHRMARDHSTGTRAHDKNN